MLQPTGHVGSETISEGTDISLEGIVANHIESLRLRDGEPTRNVVRRHKKVREELLCNPHAHTQESVESAVRYMEENGLDYLSREQAVRYFVRREALERVMKTNREHPHRKKVMESIWNLMDYSDGYRLTNGFKGIATKYKNKVGLLARHYLDDFKKGLEDMQRRVDYTGRDLEGFHRVELIGSALQKEITVTKYLMQNYFQPQNAV